MRADAPPLALTHADGSTAAHPFSWDRYGWVRVSAVRHAAEGTERWIANRLDDMAARNGYGVMCGRLYTAADLVAVGPRPLEGLGGLRAAPYKPWPHDDCPGSGMQAWDR